MQKLTDILSKWHSRQSAQAVGRDTSGWRIRAATGRRVRCANYWRRADGQPHERDAGLQTHVSRVGRRARRPAILARHLADASGVADGQARPGQAGCYRPGTARAPVAVGYPLPREAGAYGVTTTVLSSTRFADSMSKASTRRKRTPLHPLTPTAKGAAMAEFGYGFRIVGGCCRRTAASRLARGVRRLCRLRPARRS